MTQTAATAMVESSRLAGSEAARQQYAEPARHRKHAVVITLGMVMLGFLAAVTLVPKSGMAWQAQVAVFMALGAIGAPAAWKLSDAASLLKPH